MKQPLSVILIEDDPTDSFLLSRLLQSKYDTTFRVHAVTTLQEAVAVLAASDFDVALLDFDLPDGSGIDSLHQLRAVDATLPIVLLTGNDDEDLGMLAINTGAQDCIAKDSISGQTLFRTLRYAVARQSKMLGLKAAANTDSLTGLPNRRSLERQFEEAVQETLALGLRLSLSLLDVDHFKQINDLHGHLVGDNVLRQVADVLAAGLVHKAKLARYGGEEFAILLPDRGLESAAEAMSGLIRSIGETPMINRNRLLRVTASAGVAEVCRGDSLAEVIDRADQALYEAKRHGRDRVCASTLHPPSPVSVAPV